MRLSLYITGFLVLVGVLPFGKADRHALARDYVRQVAQQGPKALWYGPAVRTYTETTPNQVAENHPVVAVAQWPVGPAVAVWAVANATWGCGPLASSGQLQVRLLRNVLVSQAP